MKKMTKIASILLITVLFISVLGGVLKTNAANGPSDSYSYVRIADYVDMQYKTLYMNGATDVVFAGASYDRSTNTLTITNLKRDCGIEANEMGDDFKIKVVGENEIDNILVWGFGHGGSLTLTGNGTVTINKEGTYYNAINMEAEDTNSALTIDNTVNVNLYALENQDLIKISYTRISDKTKAVVLKNGQSITVNKSLSTQKMISAYYPDEDEINDYCPIYKDSNNKEYVVIKYQNDTTYVYEVYDITTTNNENHLTENTTVDGATLTPVYVDNGLYNYSVPGSSLSIKAGAAAQTELKSSDVTLKSTSATYTGNTIKPAVTVKSGKTTLKNGTDYTVSYKDNKKVGTATVTVTGKGKYKGTVKKTFKINPTGTTLNKLTAASKAFKATWKKQTTETTGYEIQYSTDKNFKKGNKTSNIGKNKTTSTTIKKLTGKKKYYARIRTYKKIGKTTYYSSWSKSKYVTTKK